MGDVTYKTGFVNDPFFNRTTYPIENVGLTTNLQSNPATGSGSATISALPSPLSGYRSLALNNLGQDTRYLYGIDSNGSETYIGMYKAPGLFSNTNIDNPNNVVLQEVFGQNPTLVFSNSTLPVGTTLTFTPGTDYVSPICFTTGTLIRTVRGDVAVEALRVGDIAVTVSGVERPITWVGHRVVDCAREAVPYEVYPVRIRAGAFGQGLPERDLFLSPGHPVLVGDHLVPIMCLINGTSIARMPVETVTYWHVELDQHDILLAEGLPAESFLDFGIRDWFGNGADHALANPDFIPAGLNGRCRPVLIEGPLVEAERRRIDTQFALDLAAQCAWPAPEAWLAV